ncbi:hypothetical protein CAMGR0001_0243 [Campylobacter gracilis RM3268]|uniref:Lipoprotein n=1 Tax=Campylobacter gracilis RM3268 TaxID=553220 RepID=C8PKM1_9BACT|nr:hypothetical protein CAMGR0001_0243 [Campylobacter gracilis RM3268]
MKLRKIASYALVSGFGLVMAGSLAGCDDRGQEQNVRLQEGALSGSKRSRRENIKF